MCICKSMSSGVFLVSVAFPSAFSDRNLHEGGRRMLDDCLHQISQPPAPPHPTPHNYTPVSICLQCINSSSWNPVLIFIRSQNYQQAGDDSDCQPGPDSQPGRAHGWPAIALARHRNTDGESNAALNTAHWRLSNHLSSSQQVTSHHSGKRIFILNKWSLERTRCT